MDEKVLQSCMENAYLLFTFNCATRWSLSPLTHDDGFHGSWMCYRWGSKIHKLRILILLSQTFTAGFNRSADWVPHFFFLSRLIYFCGILISLIQNELISAFYHSHPRISPTSVRKYTRHTCAPQLTCRECTSASVFTHLQCFFGGRPESTKIRRRRKKHRSLPRQVTSTEEEWTEPIRFCCSVFFCAIAAASRCIVPDKQGQPPAFLRGLFGGIGGERNIII